MRNKQTADCGSMKGFCIPWHWTLQNFVFNDFTWILHDPLLRTRCFRGLESILASCMIEILLSRSKLYQVRLLSTSHYVKRMICWFAKPFVLFGTDLENIHKKKKTSRWYLWKKTLTRKKWKSQWMLVLKELRLGKDFGTRIRICLGGIFEYIDELMKELGYMYIWFYECIIFIIYGIYAYIIWFYVYSIHIYIIYYI